MKLVIILLLSLSLAHAIITIAPVEIGSKPGLSGKLSGSLQTKRGNTEKDEYSAGLRLQYDSNVSDLFWADIIGSYGEASGKTNTNKFYFHLRYLHQITEEKLVGELFLQSEGNEFTKIKHRRLAGGGLRYRVSDNVIGKFYIGLGGFYEDKQYTTDTDPDESSVRVNSYISYTKKFGEKSKVSYVGYYQPKTSDFSDAVISNGLELKIHVVEKIYITLQAYYDIDTKPAVGIEKYDFTQKTLFIWEF